MQSLYYFYCYTDSNTEINTLQTHYFSCKVVNMFKYQASINFMSVFLCLCLCFFKFIYTSIMNEHSPNIQMILPNCFNMDKTTDFSLVLILRNSCFNPNEIFKNIKPEQLNKVVIISLQFDKLVRILKMHYKARSVS